jgi:hypothetical protein
MPVVQQERHRVQQVSTAENLYERRLARNQSGAPDRAAWERTFALVDLRSGEIGGPGRYPKVGETMLFWHTVRRKLLGERHRAAPPGAPSREGSARFPRVPTSTARSLRSWDDHCSSPGLHAEVSGRLGSSFLLTRSEAFRSCHYRSGATVSTRPDKFSKPNCRWTCQ